MYIDVYKFLIRIFAIGRRASLLCVYFDALIFKGKSMLRWQEGFYYIKETGVSAHAAGKGFPILHTFPPAFVECSLWVGNKASHLLL